MGLAAQIAQAARRASLAAAHSLPTAGGTKARLFGRGDPRAAPRGAAPSGSGAVGYLSVASSRDSARLRSYESYLGAINIPDVFKCLSTIANTFAATDLRILDQDDEDVDLRERLPELDALMRRPNPEMRSRQFRQVLSHHLQLTGNAIVLKDNYDGLGRPTELWPLRPDKVHIVRSDIGKLAYGYDVTGGGKTRTEWYSGEEILHTRFAHPSDPLWGLGVIEAGEQAFSRARLVNEFCVNFFSRGAIVDGILETAQEIPEEDRRTLISDWRAFREGARNKLRTAVLWAGAKYTPIQEPLGNVPVMDLTKMSRNDIFQLFGVPPQLAGDFEGTNYRNAQEASQYFYGETLGPQLAQFAEDFWNPLIEDFDPELRAEYEQREVIDYQVRATATAQLAGTGSFSVNDLRVAAGYDPLPEDDELGDLIPLPKGMTLLSPEQAAQLGEQAQEAPEELPPAPQVTQLGPPPGAPQASGAGQAEVERGQQATGGHETAQEQQAGPQSTRTKAGCKSYPEALLSPLAREAQQRKSRKGQRSLPPTADRLSPPLYALPGGKGAPDTAPARTTRAGAVADASGSPLEREGRRSSVAPPSDHGAAGESGGGPRVVTARPHTDDLERIKRAYVDWAGSEDEEALWDSSAPLAGGTKDGWVTIDDHPVYIGGSGGSTSARVEDAKRRGTYGAGASSPTGARPQAGAATAAGSTAGGQAREEAGSAGDRRLAARAAAYMAAGQHAVAVHGDDAASLDAEQTQAARARADAVAADITATVAPEYQALWTASGGRLTVTPRQPSEVGGRAAGLEDRETAGVYKTGANSAYVFSSNHAQPDDPRELSGTAIHEMGHGIDWHASQLLGGEDAPRLSEQDDFRAVYENNKSNGNLWGYMRSSPQEMFAEGFANYYGRGSNSSTGLMLDAPDVFNYFADLRGKVRDALGR